MNHWMPLLTLLISCSNQAQPAGELLPEAFAKAATLKDIQLLDVRTAREYQDGHLKGSLQADWTDRQQFFDRTQYLDKNRPVFVYCLSGGRSHAAAQYLRAQGFLQVTNLSGGMSAWKIAGLPVEPGNTQLPQTTWQQYNDVISSAQVILVDFGAEWCPPCRQMEPILASYMRGKSDKRIRLVKMDGGLEVGLMKSLGVQALPTFILYRNGVEEKRLQGVMTSEALEKWVSLQN